MGYWSYDIFQWKIYWSNSEEALEINVEKEELIEMLSDIIPVNNQPDVVAWP